MIENTAQLVVDKSKARELWKEYRARAAHATDEDRAIMTAYRQIARGKVVIQAIESIRKAGRNEGGTPKLALTRADVKRCHCRFTAHAVEFSAASQRWPNSGSGKAYVSVSQMPTMDSYGGAVAIVPLIPLHLRPTKALTNYWILWEADWTHAPVDPLLLRRLKGDLWLVLAAWELTAVERAVLAERRPS